MRFDIILLRPWRWPDQQIDAWRSQSKTGANGSIRERGFAAI